MKIIAVLKKADQAIALILKYLAIVLCLLIAFILLGRVILRLPFFTASMSWSEEIIELTMAWMILTMGTILFRNREHFHVELLERALGDRLPMKIVRLFITLISLVFFAMLLFYGIKFMLPQTQFSPILKINHRFYYASVPVNALLIVFYLIRDLVRDIAALRKPGAGDQTAAVSGSCEKAAEGPPEVFLETGAKQAE